MSKDLVLSNARYTKLVTDLRRLIDVGRAKAQSAANFELLKTYWDVGGRLLKERLSESAGYGESIMERLAVELQTDRSTLVRCQQFHVDYPKGPPTGTTLSWSHYRILVSVKDDEARAFYEKTAQEKEWSRDEMMKAIRDDHYGLEDPADKNRKPPKKLKRPEGKPFVYPAEVKRVIDGDTLLALMDLGFDVWKKERIRFADVDAPPIKEDGGEEAYAYVRDQLAKAKTVVIATHKEDVHGRYVGHIFYSLDERETWEKVYREGRWLNQELLDRGLARVY